MSSLLPAVPTRQTRLDTWKSIAFYLGRSSRTVQRWHTLYGLPVHHLSGESGSVYAYAEDLDRWLRERGRLEGTDSATVRDDLSRDDSEESYLPSPSGRFWTFSVVSPHDTLRSEQLVSVAAQMWGSVSNASLPAMLRHYREAIDLNPANASAYAGLSLGLVVQAVSGGMSSPLAYASAAAALNEAMKIDSELPLAKAASAWLDTLSTRDWRRAQKELDDIAQLSTAVAQTMNCRGLLLVAEQRLEEACACFLEGARQQPLSFDSMILYCWCKYLAGDFALALYRMEEIRTAGRPSPLMDAVEALALLGNGSGEINMDRLAGLAERSPDHEVLQGALGYAYAMTGEPRKARRLLEGMTDKWKGGVSREPYGIAVVSIALEEMGEAFDFLEHSYCSASIWSLGFRSDPILASLRSDPLLEERLNNFGYPAVEQAE